MIEDNSATPPQMLPFFNLHQESGTLRLSIAFAFVVSALGIIFGLISGSFSIVFDGVYSLVDAIMTATTLVVINLIALSAASRAQDSKINQRFSVGLWHLEPMLLVLNGSIFMIVAIYAIFNAVITIMNGGHELAFGWAIVYAVFTAILCATAATLTRRANKSIKSDFIALDSVGWIMSFGISAALILAFTLGYLAQGTRLEWLTPYIDPAILALVCLVILPAPIGTLRRGFADMLLYTPPDLSAQVDQAATDFAEKHGFTAWRAYVARIGRARQIEVHFIVADGSIAHPITYWDALREEFSDKIGGEGPNRWLTVAFTSDIEWAE